MWGSEVLIYGYGAVCLSMIVFNIVYNIMLRRREPRTKKKAKRVRNALAESYGAPRRDGASVWPKAGEFLRASRLKLERYGDLMTLSEALLELLQGEQREAAERFIQKLQPELPALAEAYLKKDGMQTAYFAVFLQTYRRSSPYDGQLLESLLSYAARETIYCRVNALDAFGAFGNADYMVKAVEQQDRMEAFLHEKVLTEGLLSFSGDHGELIEKLLEHFEDFSDRTRHSVLTYIRFQSGDCQEFMYRVMADENADRELRLSAIRYFGKYPWEPARGMLLAFAGDTEPLNWEYAAVAAAALKDYRGEDVTLALKSALYSSNWYVRYNAAVSLEAEGLSYSQLIDIMAGKDRYAREMMGYRLEERRLLEEGGRAT